MLLSSYWLVSGYGLRAWRAFLTLAVLVSGCALLRVWGFPENAEQTYGSSFRIALRSTTSLLQAPAQELTAAGDWLEIVLRLAGPLVFGPALRALRGRVKR